MCAFAGTNCAGEQPANPPDDGGVGGMGRRNGLRQRLFDAIREGMIRLDAGGSGRRIEISHYGFLNVVTNTMSHRGIVAAYEWACGRSQLGAPG